MPTGRAACARDIALPGDVAVDGEVAGEGAGDAAADLEHGAEAADPEADAAVVTLRPPMPCSTFAFR